MEDAVYDYSWARPDFGGQKIGGVIRYVSNDSSKNITKAEYEGYRLFNVPVGLVWETSTNRAKAGWLAGLADGREANRQADVIGYPIDAVIYYACDEWAKNDDNVVLYFAGVTYAGGRPIGFYGGDNPGSTILYRGYAKYLWQAAATSWSDQFPSPYACLVQQIGTDVAGTDLNIVQSPWGGDGAEKLPEEVPPEQAPPPAEEGPPIPSLGDIVAQNVLPRLDALENRDKDLISTGIEQARRINSLELANSDLTVTLQNSSRDLLTTLAIQAKRIDRLEAALREGTRGPWRTARAAIRERLARVLDT